MPDIVVIGGGITGTATADALAREGHAVTLIEARSIAAMASGWTLGGVRQSGRDPAELPLARAAVAIWAELRETLDADVEYRRNGNLRLARTPAEFDVIRALVAGQRERGLDIDFLPDNAAVRAIAPALSANILAASFCPTDGHANPIKATHALAESARRHRATIRENVAARAIRVARDRVTGIETDAGFISADRVIVSAGVNTPELLRPLGLDLPLSIRIVTVVQSEPLSPCFDQVFGVANADCAGRQEADGRLRFTGGLGQWELDPARWTTDSLAPSASEVRNVVDLVANVLPAAGRAPIARTWGGLIDLTPDALPVIDAPESVAGLVVAAGFSGHGFCLGPISGLLCADLALERRPRLDLSAFRLGRFKDKSIATADLTLHG
ncbi:MAG TPA: FAD-binding oxidoreductase [Casimicrobiaceae bacterium]|nr:FAD-binding oxidoreductase [Casimicrobiaceae bacterium]